MLQVRKEGWGSLCRPDADKLNKPALIAAAAYSDVEANILCKQAGFKAGAVAPPPPVPETTRLRPQFEILYRDCKGTEASVFDCSDAFLQDPDFYIFDAGEYCDHYYDVAAACGNVGTAGALISFMLPVLLLLGNKQDRRIMHLSCVVTLHASTCF